MKIKRFFSRSAILPLTLTPIVFAISCGQEVKKENNYEMTQQEKQQLVVARTNYKNAMDVYNNKLNTYATELKTLKSEIDKEKDKNKKNEKQQQRKDFVASKAAELTNLRNNINSAFKALNLAEIKSETQTVKIFSTNDEHGRLKFDDGKYNNYSGMEGLARFLQNVDYSLLVSAGDLIQGLPLSDSDKGLTISLVAKEMGYNAIAVGNHEFDFGLDHMLGINEKTKDKMPFLSANIFYKDNITDVNKRGKRPFQPYKVVTLKNNLKVALVGITTPDTTITSHPNNSKDVIFKDPVTAANEIAKEIREKENVNFIVALTHLGVGRNKIEWDSKYFAKNAKGIDLIIDGHSHNKINITKEENAESYLTQSESYTQYLSELDLLFNKKTGQIETVAQSQRDINEIELASHGKENQNVDNLIKELESKYGDINNKKVFDSPIDFEHVTLKQFDGEEFSKGRIEQTNLGIFTANALADEIYLAKKAEADFATLYNKDHLIGLVNGGGLRSNISAGEVKRGDVLGVLPFGNRISAVKINGHTLLETIKHGVSKIKSGGYPQFSDNIEFDIQKTGHKQYQLNENSVKINGKALNLEATYIIATNDFLLVGGDGYTMLNYSKNQNVKHEYEGGDILDIVIKYAQKTSKEGTQISSEEKSPFTLKIEDYKKPELLGKIKIIDSSKSN